MVTCLIYLEKWTNCETIIFWKPFTSIKPRGVYGVNTKEEKWKDTKPSFLWLLSVIIVLCCASLRSPWGPHGFPHVSHNKPTFIAIFIQEPSTSHPTWPLTISSFLIHMSPWCNGESRYPTHLHSTLFKN